MENKFNLLRISTLSIALIACAFILKTDLVAKVDQETKVDEHMQNITAHGTGRDLVRARSSQRNMKTKLGQETDTLYAMCNCHVGAWKTGDEGDNGVGDDGYFQCLLNPMSDQDGDPGNWATCKKICWQQANWYMVEMDDDHNNGGDPQLVDNYSCGGTQSCPQQCSQCDLANKTGQNNCQYNT